MQQIYEKEHWLFLMTLKKKKKKKKNEYHVFIQKEKWWWNIISTFFFLFLSPLLLLRRNCMHMRTCTFAEWVRFNRLVSSIVGLKIVVHFKPTIRTLGVVATPIFEWRQISYYDIYIYKNIPNLFMMDQRIYKSFRRFRTIL